MSCQNDGEISVINVTYDNYLAVFNGGVFSVSGKVVVCQNGIFGSVCDADWDQNDADVLCNSVGIGSGIYGETLLTNYNLLIQNLPLLY